MIPYESPENSIGGEEVTVFERPENVLERSFAFLRSAETNRKENEKMNMFSIMAA